MWLDIIFLGDGGRIHLNSTHASCHFILARNDYILRLYHISLQVHIKILDINDHAPVFTQKVYKSTIAENLQLNPPATILQVRAEDKDEGINGKVQYRIVEQTEPGKYLVKHSAICSA